LRFFFFEIFIVFNARPSSAVLRSRVSAKKSEKTFAIALADWYNRG
jgi:hypothetical protein